MKELSVSEKKFPELRLCFNKLATKCFCQDCFIFEEEENEGKIEIILNTYSKNILLYAYEHEMKLLKEEQKSLFSKQELSFLSDLITLMDKYLDDPEMNHSFITYR